MVDWLGCVVRRNRQRKKVGMPKVEPLTVPRAGVDTLDIQLEETYEVEGVGKDTLHLSGTLVADRGAPLIDPKQREVQWATSTVVACFRSLNARGVSKIFGPVHVALDHQIPSFGVVTDGKCRAALSIIVSMPEHDLQLRSAEPVQLHSEVTTIPPVGDERTQSIAPVALVDTQSRRTLGTIESARVIWRDLTVQIAHEGPTAAP